MMRREGSVRTRVVSGVVGVCLLAGLFSGCTSARSSLGTGDSSCYLDLPTAAAAVGNHGRFVGIHLFSLTQLRKKAPHLVADLTDKKSTASHMCVAAYEGTYLSSEVQKPLTRTDGRLAVAVVDANSNKLLGTLIIKRPPLHFGHPHVG
jgi:hypothetical protein